MTVSGSSSHNHISTSQVQGARGPAKSDSASTSGYTEGTSQVQVSNSAREMAEVARLAQNAPASRDELVSQIKSQIQSGEYQVNLDKLADRMADVL